MKRNEIGIGRVSFRVNNDGGILNRIPVQYIFCVSVGRADRGLNQLSNIMISIQRTIIKL